MDNIHQKNTCPALGHPLQDRLRYTSSRVWNDNIKRQKKFKNSHMGSQGIKGMPIARKPDELLYIPKVLKNPDVQNPDYDMAEKEMETQFGLKRKL